MGLLKYNNTNSNYYSYFSCVGSLLLSLVVVSRGYSSLTCMGFSLQWFLLLGNMGSGCRNAGAVVVALGLEHGLTTCGAWASLIRGIWNLSRPGIQPMSPALAGRFLSIAPPQKSLFLTFDVGYVF